VFGSDLADIFQGFLPIFFSFFPSIPPCPIAEARFQSLSFGTKAIPGAKTKSYFVFLCRLGLFPLDFLPFVLQVSILAFPGKDRDSVFSPFSCRSSRLIVAARRVLFFPLGEAHFFLGLLHTSHSPLAVPCFPGIGLEKVRYLFFTLKELAGLLSSFSVPVLNAPAHSFQRKQDELCRHIAPSSGIMDGFTARFGGIKGMNPGGRRTSFFHLMLPYLLLSRW